MLFATPDITILIPIFIGILYLFVIVCKWIVFKKLHVMPLWSVIPLVSEYFIFKRCWKVWPYLLLLALAFAFIFFVRITGYVDFDLPIPEIIKTNMNVLALSCLALIHILKYKRLAFAFGHDYVYLMGLLFFNPIFMGMLAFSKENEYKEKRAKLEGKELRAYLKEHRTLLNRVLSAVSAVIIVVAGLISCTVLERIS